MNKLCSKLYERSISFWKRVLLDSRSHLSYTEWFIIVGFFALFVTFAMVSHVASEGAKESIEDFQKVDNTRVFIHVDGAVKYPGTYEVKKGSLVKEVFEKVEPLPEADFSGIDGNDQVMETKSLYIPEQGWIEVTVKGAVKEEKRLRVRSKSRICDLLNKIELDRDADRRFIRRKRVLKDGEEVIFPRKKEKK